MFNTAINMLYARERSDMAPRLTNHYITEADKMKIYHLHVIDNVPSGDIARRFGWSQPTIMRIINRMTKQVQLGAGRCGRPQ